MKIPKRVNNALDWVEDNIGAITAVTALVVVAVSAMWLPTFAALVVGALIGGVVVRWRMTRRVRRLRAEIDDLLRENGALRHERTVLSQRVIVSSGQLTQKLPIISRIEEGPDGRRPVLTGTMTHGLAAGETVREPEREVDGQYTERLPLIPWADDSEDESLPAEDSFADLFRTEKPRDDGSLNAHSRTEKLRDEGGRNGYSHTEKPWAEGSLDGHSRNAKSRDGEDPRHGDPRDEDPRHGDPRHGESRHGESHDDERPGGAVSARGHEGRDTPLLGLIRPRR